MAFVHHLDPFKNLSKDDFDTKVRIKAENALKDLHKSFTSIQVMTMESILHKD